MTKHVHYKKIIEWAKDTSQSWQFRGPNSDVWHDINSGSPSWEKDLEYRKKPREFKEGFWYPIVNNAGLKLIAKYDGNFRIVYPAPKPLYSPDELAFIGEGFKPDFGDN